MSGRDYKDSETGRLYLAEMKDFAETLNEWKGYADRLMVANGAALATTYAFVSESKKFSDLDASMVIMIFTIGLMVSMVSFVALSICKSLMFPLKKITLRVMVFFGLLSVGLAGLIFILGVTISFAIFKSGGIDFRF